MMNKKIMKFNLIVSSEISTKPRGKFRLKSPIIRVSLVFNLAGRFIIKSSNTWKVRWDMMILVLALYNCFVIPFDVAFLVSTFYLIMY